MSTNGTETITLRGMTTVTFLADDVAAARDWYAALLGVDAYFQMPAPADPAYVEFRLGDDEDELGIMDRRFAPGDLRPEPGGAILYWHVDDLAGTVAALKAAGARVLDPGTPRGTGFVTASVVDPFGNILGVMANPHWAGRHGG